MRLDNIIKKLFITGAIISSTYIQGQNITNNLKDKIFGKYEGIEFKIENWNDQMINGLIKSNETHDEEGNTVGGKINFNFNFEKAKINSGIESNLYQRAIKDRRIQGTYYVIGITKTELHLGVQTKTNDKGFSQKGEILFNNIKEGKSHLTELRDWFHKTIGASPFVTLLSDELNSIGISYDLEQNRTVNVNRWKFNFKTSIGADLYTGTDNKKILGLNNIINSKQMSFIYLSNINSTNEIIISYKEKKKKIPRFIVRGKIQYKQYQNINYKEIEVFKRGGIERFLIKKEGLSKLYKMNISALPSEKVLNIPKNNDMIYSMEAQISLYSNKLFGISAILKVTDEQTREHVMSSVNSPEKIYSIGFKLDM